MRRQTCAARHAPPDMRRQTGVLLSCIAVQRQSRQMSGAGPTCKGVPSPPSLLPARARGRVCGECIHPMGAEAESPHPEQLRPSRCSPAGPRRPAPCSQASERRCRRCRVVAAWELRGCAAARILSVGRQLRQLFSLLWAAVLFVLGMAVW